MDFFLSFLFRSSYQTVAKNFDNISDPIPNIDKKERYKLVGVVTCREIGDLVQAYGSTLSQEQRSVFEMILKGYVRSVYFSLIIECVFHRRCRYRKELSFTLCD